MIWLGLDTSIAAYGYAVLTNDTGPTSVLAVGTWKTKVDKKLGKLADRALRVEAIGQQLLELVNTYKPEAACVESLALGMKTGRGTAQTLGRMRGLTEGILLAKGIELSEVRPEQLKFVVCGGRGASKEDVA